MNMNKIYVSSLPESISKTEIEAYFCKYGKIVEVVLKKNHGAHFAFVRFSNSESVDRVFEWKSHYLKGLLVVCEKARNSNEENVFRCKAAFSSSNSKGIQHTSFNDPRILQTSSSTQKDAPKESFTSQSRRIWVGGISKHLTDDDIFEAFGKYGEVDKAFVARDNFGHSKGFGYVTFQDSKTVDRVLALPAIILFEKQVTVKLAVPEVTMNKYKMYISGLSATTTQTDVLNYFSKFGEVAEAVMKTSNSKRFAFVRFVRRSSMELVANADSHTLNGCKIRCERAHGSKRNFNSSRYAR